jgi:hypothetical protein
MQHERTERRVPRTRLCAVFGVVDWRPHPASVVATITFRSSGSRPHHGKDDIQGPFPFECECPGACPCGFICSHAGRDCIENFALFLALPDIPYISRVHLVAELLLALWLLVVGVNEGKWRAQALAAVSAPPAISS